MLLINLSRGQPCFLRPKVVQHWNHTVNTTYIHRSNIVLPAEANMRKHSMVKTLTKHGNSYALVIDKPILDLLKIQPDSPLEITTDGRVLTISLANPEERRERIAQALEQVNAKHGKVLKRLAE